MRQDHVEFPRILDGLHEAVGNVHEAGGQGDAVPEFGVKHLELVVVSAQLNLDASEIRERKRARVRQLAARTALTKRSIASALCEHWGGRARRQMSCYGARFYRFAPWISDALRLKGMAARICSPRLWNRFWSSDPAPGVGDLVTRPAPLKLMPFVLADHWRARSWGRM